MRPLRNWSVAAMLVLAAGLVVWVMSSQMVPADVLEPQRESPAVVVVDLPPAVPGVVVEPVAEREIAPSVAPPQAEPAPVAAQQATTVTVIVQAADGAPVVAIVASLTMFGEKAMYRRGYTDERGEWHVAVTGSGAASVALGCGLTRDVTLREGEEHRIAFVLPPSTEVTGRVLDAQGLPIAGAALLLAAPATTDNNILPEPVAISDANGNYHVRHLVALSRLGARARGFAASPLFVVGSKREWPRPFDIVLARGGARIEGRVTDTKGDPIADATLQITTKVRFRPMLGTEGKPAASYSSHVRCSSAPDGTFAIDGLEPGQVRVVVWAPRYARHVVDLVITTGETAVVPLQLDLGATLVGRVVDTEGNPIADAPILCGRDGLDGPGLPRTRTDAEGNFHLGGLPAGVLLVRARSPGALDGKEMVTFVSGEVTTLRFCLAAAPQLSGCVFDADGRPADNVVVSAREPDTRVPVSGMERTDRDGRFTLPCTSQGIVALWVRRDGMTAEVVAMTTNCPSSGLNVRLADCAGSPTSVCGVLLDAGVPIAYQSLILLTGDGRRRPGGVTSPGSGAFAVNVPPGNYELRTRRDGVEVKLAAFAVVAGQQLDLGRLGMPVEQASSPR